MGHGLAILMRPRAVGAPHPAASLGAAAGAGFEACMRAGSLSVAINALGNGPISES